MELLIPAISVDASVYSRSVGTNGQMGNPVGAWDAIWYDFSGDWPSLGGYPGEPGANAVFAGHVDYIGVGPAVFWGIRDLAPGDRVTVTTSNGPVTYVIQWSQWAEPDIDFAQFVAKTGQDVITLVTCIGDFSEGHYSNRLIVRGVRV
jgi:LPXTG-site transpeptidase (sortase) family protein